MIGSFLLFHCWQRVDVVEIHGRNQWPFMWGVKPLGWGKPSTCSMLQYVKNNWAHPVFAENWSPISFLAWLIQRFLHARQHSQSWDVSPLTDRWTPALSRARSAKQPSKCYGIDKMPLSLSWQAKTLILICVSPSHSDSRLIKTLFAADKEIPMKCRGQK